MKLAGYAGVALVDGRGREQTCEETLTIHPTDRGDFIPYCVLINSNSRHNLPFGVEQGRLDRARDSKRYPLGLHRGEYFPKEAP